MANVPQRNDLGARLDRLERAVSNLQRQSTLSSASISEGNLTIRRGGNVIVTDGGNIEVQEGGDVVVTDGGNIELRDDGELRIGDDAQIVVEGDTPEAESVLVLGDLTGAGEGQRGLMIFQRDGTQVAILADDGASIMDARGQDALATQRDGYGLTSPWLTWGWTRSDLAGWATTDSSDWTTLYESRPVTLHPVLRLEAGFITGGTAGQLRFVVDGNVVGTSPVYTESANYGVDVDVAGMDTALKHSAVVELQARRTSGDSTVAVRPYQALGRD